MWGCEVHTLTGNRDGVYALMNRENRFVIQALAAVDAANAMSQIGIYKCIQWIQIIHSTSILQVGWSTCELTATPRLDQFETVCWLLQKAVQSIKKQLSCSGDGTEKWKIQQKYPNRRRFWSRFSRTLVLPSLTRWLMYFQWWPIWVFQKGGCQYGIRSTVKASITGKWSGNRNKLVRWFSLLSCSKCPANNNSWGLCCLLLSLSIPHHSMQSLKIKKRCKGEWRHLASYLL